VLRGRRNRPQPPSAPQPPSPPAAAAPATRPPGKTRRRLRVVLFGALTLGVLALGWYAWGWYTAPAPPEVSLADADPAVAQAIEAARRDVWWKPRSAAAWGRLGQLLRAHGYVPQSNDCFAQAERLAPDEPRWPYLHGAGLQSADPEAAIGHLQRAVALCGGVPDAPQLTLAEVCLQQGRFDEAEQQFHQVLGRDPGNARAHLGLGRLACERRNPRDALGHLEQAASSRLTQKAARLLLAQAYQQLGDTAAAGRERARALDLPDDPPWPDPFQEEVQDMMIGKQARLARLQTLHRQGRDAEALELARQLEKDYPDVYWLVEGRGQMSRGDLAAAERALRKAVELAPDSVEAQFDLGTVLFEQRNYPAAADCFRKVTELEPSHGAAYLRLGRCLEAQGDRAGALRAFQAAVRYVPQQAEAHRELGACLAREGRRDEAAAHLRQALQLQPGDTKARELLDQVSRREP
jgi:tetratricopeptide (TPR) repeat protein